MNTYENKIRKHWFVSTFCFFLCPIALLFLIEILSKKTAATEVLIGFLAKAFVEFLSLLLIWHCAYKKPGTKLLTFWLFSTSIGMLISIVGLKKNHDFLSVAFVLVEVALFPWWLLMSIKMRDLNKSIQEKILQQNLTL